MENKQGTSLGPLACQAPKPGQLLPPGLGLLEAPWPLHTARAFPSCEQSSLVKWNVPGGTKDSSYTEKDRESS